jgi:hypothetical protein
MVLILQGFLRPGTKPGFGGLPALLIRQGYNAVTLAGVSQSHIAYDKSS